MAQVNETVTYRSPSQTQWYEPVQISASTLQCLAKSSDSVKKTLSTLKRLTPDDYLHYILGYYQSGLTKFKESWQYSDLLTHLQAAAQLIQPQNYLEIGVRRGRSLAVVARTCPKVELIGFDLWVQNYAGMENPGPHFVTKELKKIGHKGKLQLISGDSKETVPAYFQQHPNAYFDMITVDGDHSEDGARLDLENTLSRLKIGGAIFLDDITHPQHLYLEKIWDEIMTDNSQFSSKKYTDLGYGIACAVRRSF